MFAQLQVRAAACHNRRAVVEIVNGANVRSVGKGDMILNPPGGRHGLVNNSDEDIDILVVQIGVTE